MKTILCYGDSNTWGYVPTLEHGFVKSRFSRDERWTGLLQKKLGDNYYVIEEGLNGRTTNIDYHIPPDRNGKTYLPSCLYSQSPLDLVIFALGGNDCKIYFNRSAEAITEGMAELIDIVHTSMYGADFNKAPHVLLISPLIPSPIIETFKDENGILFMEGTVGKVEKLLQLYKELAVKKNCHYLEVAHELRLSEIDGIHLDLHGHAKLAKMLADKIKQIGL